MSGCARLLTLLLLIPVWYAPSVLVAERIVNLEWRPAEQSVPGTPPVEVALFAVSGTAADEPVAAITAILVWDPTYLELMGSVDPCQEGTCPSNGYEWSSSGFHLDSAEGGLNETFSDGNALFNAFVGMPTGPPAVVTPAGLWVTTIRFQTLRSGQTEVRLQSQFGEGRRTLVVSAAVTGLDVTGQLGPPAVVTVEGCPPPTVSAIGCRYIAVTSAEGALPVALLVTGDPADSAVACVSTFVQPDGSLGSAPVFRTPAAWGTVNIAGYQIIPSAEYLVRAACGSDGHVEYLSTPAHATTWVWGDVDNNGQVYIDDVRLVLDGADGVIPEGVMLENLDLAPCRPDGIIDVDDEADVRDAFAGAAYGCDDPCWTGHDLDDLLRFLPCMAGPDELAVPGCEEFDSDGDGDVDLIDFAEFQRAFGGLQDGTASTPFSGR